MSRADLTLLLIPAIWGTTFALLRDTMRTLHPFDLMAIRFSLATALLAALYAKRLWPLRRRWLVDGAWLGVWLAVGYLTQVLGLRTISASRSAFITAMSVVLVPFVAFALLRARTVLGEALGVALVLVGLACFSADAGFALRPGELWTLGCAFAFAFQIVVTQIVAKRSDVIALSVVQMAVGAAVGWLLVAARGGFSVPLARVPWGVLVYLSVIATALVIALQTWALPRTTSTKAAVLYSTEPIFAALFAAAFFAERMTSRELGGAALILAGVILSELSRPAAAWLAARRKARAPELREAGGPR